MDRTASLRNPPAVPDYQVLRLIGRGAYGEVWLALNVLGQYRAVKVIRRDSFGHEHPFDREFEGLKKYEPISRSHESQVDILHVGRNDAQGYFYYVMELADRATDERANAGPRSDPNELPGVVASLMDPEDYVPRTLHYEIRRHGRMPVGECVQIGLKLTIALEVLHKHGLVHRDVKPSNIIFVDGLPKLADIGMVMRLDETRSFVGTEGFVPPEGPGTPQADIYSLGKVLYEASTGRDSREFPDLPEDLRQLPEKWELAELNEIIVKACAPERHQRYRSAHEMHADLALLDAGKSIRAKRLRERHRFVSVCVAAGCCALLAVFLTSPPYLKRSPAARSIDGGSSSATRKADSGPSGSESPVESSKLHLLWELPAAGLGTHYQGIAANWRQGGEHVIFLLQSTKLLRVSASGGFLGVWDLPAGRSDYFNLSMIADDDRSGADKAFVGWRAGGDLFISVISQNMYESKRFHVQGATRSGIRDDEGISSIDAIKLTDLERDGARELLVSVGTGIGGQFKPRGLYCFNYEDHALLWQHQTGPWVTTVETMDLDGDGLEEVVMGTHAVANGNVASDGTDDQHAYLYALRHDGQTFWLKKLGDDRTAVMPFWVRCGEAP